MEHVRKLVSSDGKQSTCGHLDSTVSTCLECLEHAALLIVYHCRLVQDMRRGDDSIHKQTAIFDPTSVVCKQSAVGNLLLSRWGLAPGSGYPNRSCVHAEGFADNLIACFRGRAVVKGSRG